MKKNLFLTLLISITAMCSLSGQSIKKSLNYQAVILDPKVIDIPGASLSGQPLSKGKVCLKFSFINQQGNVDYEETQQTTTDEYGLVSLSVGTGAYNAGTYKTFESIVWDANVKSMKVAVSYDGCTSFKQVSTQILNYTPYALYAEAVDYKNVKDAPTKLSQFSNDSGFLIPKDLDPIKADIKINTADIKSNTSQISSANQTIEVNKKSSDESFLIVNQSITGLGTKILSNTNSITSMEGKLSDQQNQINDNRNQINTTNSNFSNQIIGLQNQVNSTVSTVSSLTSDVEVLANKSTASNLGGANPSDRLYPSQKAAKAYVDNAIYEAVGSGVPDATTLAAGKLKLAGDLGGTASSPTVPGLTTKESLSNKSTATSLGTSNDLYPTQNAVKTYVDQATQGIALQAAVDAKADKNSPIFTGTPSLPTGTIAVTQNGADNSTKIATTAFVQLATAAGTADASAATKGKLKLSGDLGGTADAPTVPGLASKANSADVTTALGLKANSSDVTSALALKEDASNKSTTTSLGTSDALYPSQKAVKAYVDAQVASATIADADISTKGKIQLAGDLGGTASAPTVPALALKANASDVTSALGLKANSADVTSSLALKSNTSDVTNALALKANSADVTNSLNLKAPLNNPTFTGTVIGITKAMVDLGNVDNTSDLNKHVSIAAQTALDFKEDATNKATSRTLGDASSSDIAYPTQKAVKTYVDNQVSSATIADANSSSKGKIQLAGDLGGTASAPTVPGLALKANSVDVGSSLALKEDLSNKSTATDLGALSSSDAAYPSQKAVKTYVDSEISAATVSDADANTKGKIKLAGDLSGNASSPTISSGAVTSSKILDGTIATVDIANGAITSDKILSVSGGKVSGSIAGNSGNVTGIVDVANGGTGNSSLTGYIKGNGTSALSTVSSIPVADVTGAIRKVNGTLPNASGEVTISFGSVSTGTLANLPANVGTNGDIYVVSGDVNAINDGRTFISDGSNWNEVTANLSTTDARYVQLAGSTMNGNLTVPTGKKIFIADAPTSSTDASNKGYVDSKIATELVDATSSTAGKIKLTGDLGGTASSPTVPGLALKANTSDMNSSLALKANTADVTNSLALKSNASDVSTSLALKANTADVTSSLALKANSSDVTSSLALKANTADLTSSLALKENVSNKSTSVQDDAGSDTKYPSVKSIKTYVDAQVTSGGTPNADDLTLGKIKLAGDLGGTNSRATAPVISDLAIGTSKLATGAVTSTKILDGEIATVDLADNSITSAKISDGAILTADLADNSISSAKILNGEIVNADISPTAAILDSKLATISTALKVSNSATTATNLNTASTIVARDANGDFSARTITATGFTGTLTGNVTGNLTGNVTGNVVGNASTATTLAATKNINGTAFDGSADITISSAAGTLTGTNLNATVVSSSLTSVGTLTDLTVINPITGSVTGNAATVTTNANLTGPITSSGNTTSIASQTGTGTKFVMDTSPNLVTPSLGVANATSVNKVAITSPATGSTLTIADGKTLAANNSITFVGTDGKTMTFPSTDATIARTDAAQTFSGTQSFSGQIVSGLSTGTAPFVVSSTTPVANLSIGGNAATATSFSGSLGGDVTGSQSTTVVGKINGTSLAGLATGILKNTTATGVPSIAVAGNDYVAPSGTFYIGSTSIMHNRSTGSLALTGITSIDGSAASLTTARTIYGNSFDGTANLSGVIESTFGGTGNGFTKFSGPNTSEKTYTLPDANATLARTDAAQTFTGTQTFSSAIAGSITGNAATVTTNANLTGDVTSIGNSTTIGAGKVTNNMLAGSIDLTSKVTGALPVANGGTGVTNATQNYVFAGPASGGVAGAPSFRALTSTDLPASLTANSVVNSITFATSGGNAANTTYNGSATKIIDYSTVGASPTAGSSSLTTVGTISSGTWNGTAIVGQYGGTGINNSGKTITLGGNLTTSGAYNTTLTSTANTSVTLPFTGTLATLDGTEILTNKTLSSPTITGTGTITAKNYVTTLNTPSTGATTAIDLSNGNFFKFSLTANTTLSISNTPNVGTYILEIIQPSSGGTYTVTFPAAWKWSGGAAPTITATNSKTDIITIVFDGTTYFASAVQNF